MGQIKMRNESNKYNTKMFLLHSLAPSRTFRILYYEKFKERLILPPLTPNLSGKEGHLCRC